MDCERCYELLSDFLDGTLSGEEGALLDRHLDECLTCAAAREELSGIVEAARASRLNFIAPPNERALWLRIRNGIEAEARAEASEASEASARAGSGFWSRFTDRRWAFTLPQLATAAAGVAVAVALVTAFGMRSVLEGRKVEEPRQVPLARARFQPNPDEMMMIEYLKQRVDQRKNRWDPRMREAFDRNMGVIDATVSEMLQELNERPHDEVSEETLNEAMRNKIELLKEFSEL